MSVAELARKHVGPKAAVSNLYLDKRVKAYIKWAAKRQHVSASMWIRDLVCKHALQTYGLELLGDEQPAAGTQQAKFLDQIKAELRPRELLRRGPGPTPDPSKPGGKSSRRKS